MRVLIVLLLLTTNLPTHAKEVVIGLGNFEPYFITHSQTGIFTEIIKETFQNIPDYQPKFIFGLSNKQLWQSFEKNKLNAISNIFLPPREGSCLTEAVFRYQDVAVTKKSRKLTITNEADLKGRSIVTYEGAKIFWQRQIKQAFEQSPYIEVQEPKRQVNMLWAERTEVSIGDVFIFLHQLRSLSPAVSIDDFDFHYIFPESYSYLAFDSPALCQQFNRALATLKSSGRYEKIYQKYQKLYQLPARRNALAIK